MQLDFKGHFKSAKDFAPQLFCSLDGRFARPDSLLYVGIFFEVAKVSFLKALWHCKIQKAEYGLWKEYMLKLIIARKTGIASILAMMTKFKRLS